MIACRWIWSSHILIRHQFKPVEMNPTGTVPQRAFIQVRFDLQMPTIAQDTTAIAQDTTAITQNTSAIIRALVEVRIWSNPTFYVTVLSSGKDTSSHIPKSTLFSQATIECYFQLRWHSAVDTDECSRGKILFWLTFHTSAVDLVWPLDRKRVGIKIHVSHILHHNLILFPSDFSIRQTRSKEPPHLNVIITLLSPTFLQPRVT